MCIVLACLYMHTPLQTNIPIFKVKESSVRRRYSDFEWLKKELERDSKVQIRHTTLHVTNCTTLDGCKVPVFGEYLNHIGIQFQ